MPFTANLPCSFNADSDIQSFSSVIVPGIQFEFAIFLRAGLINQVMTRAIIGRSRKRETKTLPQPVTEDPCTPPVGDSEEYYPRRFSVNSAVTKTKSGDYAHATFSVPDRISTPLFLRMLDFTHLVVHHTATQTLDCLLSVYIG